MRSIRTLATGLLLAVTACSHTEANRGQPAPATPPPPAPPVLPAAASPVVLLDPPSGAPIRVRVEVARTPDQRSRGLMFRRALDADAGMIFLFDRAERQVFWMHNTLIPLDIVFIGADHRVAGIVESATPETDTGRAVEGLSQYVLEVNGGFCRQNRIGIGTLARFEGF